MELAFERVGMPIRWQGPKGVEETGVMAGGSQAGRTVVTISPHFFRPVEVTAHLIAFQKDHLPGCSAGDLRQYEPTCLPSQPERGFLVQLDVRALTNHELAESKIYIQQTQNGCCRAQ